MIRPINHTRRDRPRAASTTDLPPRRPPRAHRRTCRRLGSPVWLLAALLACSGCGLARGPADRGDGTATGGQPGPGFGAQPRVTATVTREIDGDTIAVAWPTDSPGPSRAAANAGPNGVEEKVRLIGIDTPETKKPNTPVECFGEAASARTAALVPPGTAVTLVRDAEERDKYGRILAYVYRAGDGLFVNAALASDGYANELTISPNVAHAPELRRAVDAARRARRGLWGSCAGPHTVATQGA
jgi:micrococcal nuclease